MDSKAARFVPVTTMTAVTGCLAMPAARRFTGRVTNLVGAA